MPVPRIIVCALLLAALVVAQGAPLPAERRSFHYGDDTHVVTLSRDLVTLGYHAMTDSSAPKTLADHRQLLEAVHLSLPPHRVAVFRTAPGVTAAAAAAVLRSESGIRFARPAYHLGDPDHPHSLNILTEDICVGLPSGSHADAEALAASLGAVVIRSFAFPGTWQMRLVTGDDRDPITVCEDLLATGTATFAHPDWLRYIGPRETFPNDPQFGSQWHLKNTGQSGGTPGADVKATFAWDITTGDPSVIVSVIDSGVERNHVDISQTPNGYNALCGAGPLNGDPTPTGCSGSYAGSHGTSCAGVAAGDWNNGTGVAGAAGSCVVQPINLLGSGLGYGTPSMEAACFDWATANGAAVITNSWGPDGVPWPLPSLVQSAFINSVTIGRGGLGCVIFWAGGNGNELISSDGYASSIYTVAVGASTNFDVRSSYSDYGPELDVVAPSNGGSAGITTTSTNSSGGSNYTSSFGGTSSASPLAAGVGALVITANPGLTWQQVKDVLKNTADQINPSSSPGANNYYDPTTGHSTWYGHGRVNAYQAVLAAQNIPTSYLSYQATTTGFGDFSIQVTNAPPLGEMLHPLLPQHHHPPRLRPHRRPRRRRHLHPRLPPRHRPLPRPRRPEWRLLPHPPPRLNPPRPQRRQPRHHLRPHHPRLVHEHHPPGELLTRRCLRPSRHALNSRALSEWCPRQGLVAVSDQLSATSCGDRPSGAHIAAPSLSSWRVRARGGLFSGPVLTRVGLTSDSRPAWRAWSPQSQC